MDYFFEQRDFFQLKDLERTLPKVKGITPMSIKEVLQSLVDDSMVDSEKIGTSIYFWAFPSKASQNRKRKLGELETKLAEMEKKKLRLVESVEKAQVGKEDTDEREEIMEELTKKRAEKEAILKELEKYRECDPEVLEKIKEETVEAKDAANRWTDNIFSTKSWVKNKFCFEESMIDKQFGIPSDFDYVE